MGASSARQLRATRETNAQNYQIYQESKDFAREQADTQWQRELEMFDKENEYNNPVNVVGRLRDAGINPALAMQGSLGSAMSSAASGGSPAMGASPTPPQMQVPDYLGADQMLLNAATGVNDSMLKATEMLKNVAAAKQTGIDTSYLEQTLNARVQKTESESEYSKMQASLYKQFGVDRTVKELNKLDKECKTLDAQADAAILDGDYKYAMSTLTRLQSQKQIKDNEFYSAYIEAKKKYIDRLVKAEVEGAEADVHVKEETAKAIPTQAQAALKSASAAIMQGHAAQLNAETQEWLSKNPQDAVSFLVRGLEENGITPKVAIKYVIDWLTDGKSSWKPPTEEEKKKIKSGLPKVQQKYFDYYWDHPD